MLLVCRKLTSDAVPEYVIDVRFCAPIAFDASASTVLASWAAAAAASRVASSVAPVSFRIIGPPASDGELSYELSIVLPDCFFLCQFRFFGLHDAVDIRRS